MPLYSYQKAPVKLDPENDKEKKLEYLEIKKKKITLGDLIIGFYNDFNKLMTTSRIASLLIPIVLVITGVTIIYKQVWPTIIQTVQEKSGFFDDNTTQLVAGEYIEMQERYSNPGSKYFAELKNHAETQNILYRDGKSAEYTQDFLISIPSLDLYDLKVKSNVDSSVEQVYDQMLTDGLAHFAGTSLPFTEMETYNIVIYGHSSSGDYYQRTKDPAAAFSILSQIRYGSEIIVKFEGKEYKYKFIKGKIVDANDLTILTGNSGQKQLTLFTCYPNGNNSKRYVATARLIK